MSTNVPLTWPQVETYWIQAGGNPQAASMAAAVADASSGLIPSTVRQTPNGTSVGLWGISKTGHPPGSTDPLANARAAVLLSNNGQDWSKWCVAWSDNDCGCNGGTYLGEGSNAVGALGSQLSPASYQVIGSTPAGTGTGASAATASASGSTSSSGTSTHSLLLIVILIAIGTLIFFHFRNRNQAQTPEEKVPEDEAA